MGRKLPRGDGPPLLRPAHCPFPVSACATPAPLPPPPEGLRVWLALPPGPSPRYRYRRCTCFASIAVHFLDPCPAVSCLPYPPPPLQPSPHSRALTLPVRLAPDRPQFTVVTGLGRVFSACPLFLSAGRRPQACSSPSPPVSPCPAPSQLLALHLHKPLTFSPACGSGRAPLRGGPLPRRSLAGLHGPYPSLPSRSPAQAAAPSLLRPPRPSP